MAHLEQQNFVKRVKQKHPLYFNNIKVLDIGSYDINGAQRNFFENSDYTGIDLETGPNVDIVCSGQEFNAADETYDTIISCECFEHNPFWAETIINAIRMLKPNGMFVFTCATTGRPIHGTKDDEEKFKYDNWKELPSIKVYDNTYYKNITKKDIQNLIKLEEVFEIFEFELDENHHDLYFWGIKK